ncbi:MAG: hypothetical protein DRQ55_01685 [Planctomycetota bacterium]|nr:MAG: hypothetical protein DRQ55_01685 [Planctomycetota bacterium]
MELPERLRAAWPALISLVVVLGTAGLARQAWLRAATDRAFAVDAATVGVVGHPAWLAPEGAAQLALRVAEGSPGRASLLDTEALTLWAERLGRGSPWVRDVLEVQPRHPGQADVRLRLRRPVLALADGAFVAADGTILPAAAVSLSPWPLQLQGAADGEALADAAAACVVFAPFRAGLDREGIVVERVLVEAGDRIVFLTSEGVALEWGRSGRNASLAVVDLPPADRVANLLAVAQKRPGLFGVERVVLWKEQAGIHLRP